MKDGSFHFRVISTRKRSARPLENIPHLVRGNVNGKTQGSDRSEGPKRKNVCVVGRDSKKTKERRC